MTTIVEILGKLYKPKKSGDGWVAQCPTHEDKHASLSIGTGRDGKLLLNCHANAGCTFEGILSALGLDHEPPASSISKRVIDCTYAYYDEAGTLLYQVVRYRPKDFRQRRPAAPDEGGPKPAGFADPLAPHGWVWKMQGVRRIPYRLPGLIAAVTAGKTIYVVEGEKDVENLIRLGLQATCNVSGAGKWLREYSEFLRGADVVLLPDNDQAGEDHMADVAASLREIAASVRTVRLPGLSEHGDPSDWIAAGGTADSLAALVADPGTEALAAPPGAPAGWRASLVYKLDAKGHATKLENALSNAVTILTEDERWKDVYWLDEFAQEITVRGAPPYEPGGPGSGQPPPYLPRPLRDDDYVRAASWLQQEYHLIVGVEPVAQAIHALTMRRTFHPVREYLNSLQWDGTERISHWLEDHCGASGGGEAADSPAYVQVVSRAWLISAVARVYEPGCKADHVLILEGPQGIRKSTLFRKLTEPWFTDEIDALGSKDAGMQLQGAWIIELSELDALSRSEITRTKAFLSKSFDRFRPPYGRTVVRYDRQCVFAGTVNHTEYLRDETGNRRFWPVRCHDDRLDIEGLVENRDQLWAEAVAAYRGGEAWHLSPAIDALAREAQQDRATVDVWENQVSEYLEGVVREPRTPDLEPFVTMEEVMKKALNLPVEKQGRGEQMRLAGSFTRLGWERKKFRLTAKKFQWRYVPRKCS